MKKLFLILLLVLVGGCIQSSEPIVVTGKALINKSGVEVSIGLPE